MTSKPSFFSVFFNVETVLSAAKVALVVGTVLNVINQGDIILNGGILSVWKILMTYSVPYLVSSYSRAMALTSSTKIY